MTQQRIEVSPTQFKFEVDRALAFYQILFTGRQQVIAAARLDVTSRFAVRQWMDDQPHE